jgi:hypothetical protein
MFFYSSDLLLCFVAALLADVLAATDSHSRRRIPMRTSSDGADRKKSEDVADVSDGSEVASEVACGKYVGV